MREGVVEGIEGGFVEVIAERIVECTVEGISKGVAEKLL